MEIILLLMLFTIIILYFKIMQLEKRENTQNIIVQEKQKSEEELELEREQRQLKKEFNKLMNYSIYDAIESKRK